MKTERKKSAKSRRVSSFRPAETNSDIYQKFTDLIIQKLEEGIVPWKQPWSEMGLPANYLSKKPYKGINLWILLSCGHQYPFYLTFKQAQALGGSVQKGSTAIPICYWNFVYRDKKTGKVIPESHLPLYPIDQVAKSGFLKEFKVFPIEKIDGIEWEFPAVSKPEEFTFLDRCHKIYNDMLCPPALVHGGSNAYYRSDIDQITMPERTLFRSSEEYYGVLYHELVHSTGHLSRLERIGITEPHPFGSEEYSREELIAEMGAGYLNNLTGILDDQLLDNSAAYIQHWLNSLKSDNRLVIEAASKAQKAVDYILLDCPF